MGKIYFIYNILGKYSVNNQLIDLEDKGLGFNRSGNHEEFKFFIL